jgi:uncharacterized membrane protein
VKPHKPEATLKITKFGSFTANFKPLPPTIPGEYLVALFGIVAASIVGWLSPTIIDSQKSRREAKIVSRYHYAIESLYNDNKIDEQDVTQLDKLKYDIANDYAKGRIGDKQYVNTKNEIPILYENIFRKMIDSLNNFVDDNNLRDVSDEVSAAYRNGKISNEQYQNIKNEISILYENIFRKMIDSLDNMSDKEGANKQLNKIANDVERMFSEGKITELHYNLLIKKLQR